MHAQVISKIHREEEYNKLEEEVYSAKRKCILEYMHNSLGEQCHKDIITVQLVSVPYILENFGADYHEVSQLGTIQIQI